MNTRLGCLLLCFGVVLGCASDPPAQDVPEARVSQTLGETTPAAPQPGPTARKPALSDSTLLEAPAGEWGSAGDARPGPLERIVDAGELRIGTSGEQPPLSMTTANGDLIGLDIAIGRVLASTMGVEARFVTLPFGELLDRLDAGEIDIVLSGMAITPERVLRADFAGPYYTSGKAVLTRRPDLNVATRLEEIDLPSLTVVVLAGSTSESFARRRLAGARVMATPRLEEAVQLVLNGGADALIADFETCHYAVLRHPGQGLLEPVQTYTVEPMGVAVSRNAPRLASLIDTYLEALQRRGVLQKTKDFWLADPSWVRALGPAR